MSRLAPKDIAEIGQHVSFSAAGGITIAALARKLGVSLPTARRRLIAYAAAHRLTLHSQPVREGARGFASARWFVSSAAPVTPPPALAPIDEHEDAALGLPAAIMSALNDDERLALRLLAKAGTATTSTLATQAGRAPDRMEGQLRTLRRKLHRLGTPMIDNDTLPDGEALFRYTGKKAP